MVILIFLIITLSILVLIHELGHFLVARKLNIKVEEFGFGFPVTPALFSIKRGETKYSFYPVLIGGFVKLYGEDEAGAGRVKIPKSHKLKTSDVWNIDNRAFIARPVGQRAAVVVAGVVMNMILAIVIFYIFLALSNFRTYLPLAPFPGFESYRFIGTKQTNYNVTKADFVVGEVALDSPAENAGILPASQILTLNGQKVVDSKVFSEVVKQQAGKEITLGLKDLRTDKEYTISVVPRKNPPKGEGAIGIAFTPLALLDYSASGEKVLSGITHPVNLLTYNLDILGKIIGFSIKVRDVQPIGSAVSGPIGIYKLFEWFTVPNMKERIINYLNLAGILSISLAFFNILPIPALDGGRLFFILIEGIFRKKVNQRFETLAHTIGMAILLALIILVTIKDIFQFLLPK